MRVVKIDIRCPTDGVVTSADHVRDRAPRELLEGL